MNEAGLSNYVRAERVMKGKAVWPLIIPINLLVLSFGLFILGSEVVEWITNWVGFHFEPKKLFTFDRELRSIACGGIVLCCAWIALRDASAKAISVAGYCVVTLFWGILFLSTSNRSSISLNLSLGNFAVFLLGTLCFVIYPLLLLFSGLFWSCRKIKERLKQRKIKRLLLPIADGPPQSNDLLSSQAPLTNQTEINSPSHDRLDCSSRT